MSARDDERGAVVTIAAGLKRAPAQADMLRRVCATNGGGLSGYREPRRVWQALHDKDLVQGKAGDLSQIVHTRLGLLVARHLQARDDA